MVVLPPKPVQWIVTKEWQGETAYIVCGGTSVKKQNLELLRGRRVIVVNSSYLAVPWADILFFGDARWINEHRREHRKELDAFKGRIVTCSAACRAPNLWGLTRVNPPPGYAEAPTHVASQKTNLQGAMNLAGHLGVRRIVILGADMGRAEDGTSHHHEPHPWKNMPGNECWDQQMAQLQLIVEPLKARGIEVINTSPISRIGWWPKKTLEEVINMSVQTEMEVGIHEQPNVAEAVQKFIMNVVAQIDTAKGDVLATTPEADVTRLNEVMAALSGDSIRFAKLIEQRPATPVEVEAAPEA